MLSNILSMTRKEVLKSEISPDAFKASMRLFFPTKEENYWFLGPRTGVEPLARSTFDSVCEVYTSGPNLGRLHAFDSRPNDGRAGRNGNFSSAIKESIEMVNESLWEIEDGLAAYGIIKRLNDLRTNGAMAKLGRRRDIERRIESLVERGSSDADPRRQRYLDQERGQLSAKP